VCSPRWEILGPDGKEEISELGGFVAFAGVLFITIILIAVVGLVVVNALKGSPWGVFTIAMTIPIAILMGLYVCYLRPSGILRPLGANRGPIQNRSAAAQGSSARGSAARGSFGTKAELLIPYHP
jgi:hypothetical protein